MTIKAIRMNDSEYTLIQHSFPIHCKRMLKKPDLIDNNVSLTKRLSNHQLQNKKAPTVSSWGFFISAVLQPRKTNAV